MPPVARRVLRLAGPASLAVIAGAGVGGALLVVVQAALIGSLVQAAFLERVAWTALVVPAAVLAGAFAARGVLGWVAEMAGARAASRAERSVRAAAAGRLPWLGGDGERTGELVLTLVDGLEALDAYCARYLPQLAIAACAPLVIAAWVVLHDPLSALVLVLTLPLVPVFMALVGLATRDATARRWRAMTILGGHFLDVVQGVVTLRIFGRARAQEETVAAVAEQHRAETMRALRSAFLSSLTLELIAALSTALLAVEIGLRLIGGGIQLADGLAILVLAPEAYLPLRRLGAEFHASREALDPLSRALAIVDAPGAAGTREPDLRRDVIVAGGVRVAPGEKVAVVGPSGAGKTTLLDAVLFGGRAPVTIGGVPRADVRDAALHAQAGWVPQRPRLFSGTVAGSIRIGAPGAADDAVAAAAAAVGLTVPLDRPVGERGELLSAGERQRVALARALLPAPPLLVLDEPGANLDEASRRRLARLLRELPATILMATHDGTMATACDRVVAVPLAEVRR